MLVRLLLLIVLIWPAANTALAQTERAAKGVLTATASGAIPNGAAISVKPPDNTDESVQFRTHLADELVRRGFTVAEKAPLVLSFWIERVVDSGSGKKGPLALSGKAGSDSKPDLRFGLNVPFPGDKSGAAKPARNRLVLILADRRDERFWQAQLVVKSPTDDIAETLSALVPSVFDHLGRPVLAKTVP